MQNIEYIHMSPKAVDDAFSKHVFKTFWSIFVFNSLISHRPIYAWAFLFLFKLILFLNFYKKNEQWSIEIDNRLNKLEKFISIILKFKSICELEIVLCNLICSYFHNEIEQKCR
jgi:hypothetical protein